MCSRPSRSPARYTFIDPSRACSPDNASYFLSYFSKPLLSLGFSLYLQTGIKYILTEGDKYLISALATLKDTGMYALSANYGGLVARMLFRPIEDSSRNLFAKLCSDSKGGPQEKDEDSRKAQRASFAQAATVLHDLLRIYSLASLIAFAVGPSAAPLLLRVVAGDRWADTGAGDVLGTYCYYIPLLAINGVSEAFVSATASTKELRTQSVWMGVFFAGFAGSAYVFLRVLEMGAKGLVLANCVNMAMRIVFNLSFVRSYFAKRGVVSLQFLCSGSLMVRFRYTDVTPQDFNIPSVLPTPYAVAVTAAGPALLNQTRGLLAPYGLLGELVRVGATGAAIASIV